MNTNPRPVANTNVQFPDIADYGLLSPQWLAQISHEIRRPVHGIVGMTSLLVETQLSTEQRDYIGILNQSAEELLQVINNIVDLIAISAGRLGIDKSDFDLREKIESVIESKGLNAHTRGIDLILRMPPALSANLMGDAERLQQVLANVIDYVMWQKPQQIILRVSVEQKTADLVHLSLRIEYTDSMAQATSIMPTEEYGIQLGWTVAQQIVAVLGGRLWTEQPTSNLSAWCLEFDFGGQLLSLADHPKPLVGNKILVFDSNDEEIAALTELIEFQGAQVLATNNMHQLIHHIEAFMPIDALIVNHTESHLDLCGTIDLLAMRVEPARMVLLLPKSNFANDVQLCHNLGVGAFISKPIKQEALISTLQNLGKTNSDLDEIQASSSNSNRLYILLAEDNNAAQWVGKKTLEKNGHTVQVVDNGLAVLEQLDPVASEGQMPFDVVLMDIEMPGMDGFETTRAIRQRETVTGRHLPILMLTAHALKEHREECFAAGADDYLVKPLSPAKLVQVLEKFKPMARPAPTVDLERALEMCGNDWDLLRSSVKIFLTEDYARQIEQLRQAITNQDSSQLQKSAHNLQGALDSLGGGVTRDLALKIEQAGREKRIVDATMLVDELEIRMREFADFYHQLD